MSTKKTMNTQKKRYALKNGILLDGSKEMIPRKGATLLIEGKKIVDIVEGGYDRKRYQEIDLQGRYILPGLINLHVHLPATGKPKKKPSDPKKLVKLITRNGITNKLGIRLCMDIPVGLGTDTGCPYITHYDMWRELAYYVKYCGVTPAFALYSATFLNAKLAG